MSTVDKNPKPKFAQNDLVLHRGQQHRVSWPLVIPVPSIVEGEFVLVPHIMYKFISEKKIFYAWEETLTAVKEGGKVNKKGRMI